MTTETKPVCFNLNDPLEKEMWELTKKMNISGWAKVHLRPLALARIAERESQEKKTGAPVTVRRVANAIDVPNANKRIFLTT
ncbi:hypothetical protein E8L90_03395 [Brevibacillus antibioticus]|uniref:Uncharacterized protein n=1 Tax=Brevibacillus antibioticus TaxID=2570228 RepID=A0A4U2Y2B0_9BACL|nr:hypothetical protein [Brevibacillus antibioticus]TKI54558.1 hypothetical protein E8L90_03395 [Brevibacillus antibioticus]